MDPCEFINADNGILHAEYALKSLRAVLDVDNNDLDLLYADDAASRDDKSIALYEQLAGLEDMLKIVMDERLARSLSGLPVVGGRVDEESMDILRLVVRIATDIVRSEMDSYPNSDGDGDDEGDVLREEVLYTSSRYDVQSDAQSALNYSLEGPLSPLTDISTSSASDEEEYTPEPTSRKNNPPCIVCGTNLPLAHQVQMPCGHTYCSECTKALVQTYISQPYPNNLFRCCPPPKPPISTHHIHAVIPPPLLKDLQSKLREAQTPLNQRIYCPRDGCKKFINPERVTLPIVKKVGYVHCPDAKCGSRICLECKALVHVGVDCDTHADNSQARVIQRQFGWGRCPGCRFVVEKISGCNEILCARCGCGFSYSVL